MKGDKKILDALNSLLEDEVAASIQYGAHAAMLENFGYKALAKDWYARQASEHEHARELRDRIVFLEGTPTSKVGVVKIATDIEAMLRNDLDAELRAQAGYNTFIGTACDIPDNGTRALLEHILLEEETHVNDIESYLTIIERAGLSAFLQTQVRE